MDNQGSKAVTRVRTAITILSILLIILGIPVLMEDGTGIAVALIGMGIGGFILNAVLKGFRSIVEASELYKERNGF